MFSKCLPFKCYNSCTYVCIPGILCEGVVKPQSGKNLTFQCRRHFDTLQVKHELSAERKEG